MSADILLQAETAMGRGDLFTAYDLARAGLEAGSDDERFKYLQVLALARMGDLIQAHERYDDYGLGASANVDVAALGARLLKDRVLSEKSPQTEALVRAAEAYQSIYARTQDPYPGVNAATLFLLGGAKGQATSIASELLVKLSAPQTYYGRATRAEALLVSQRVKEACDEIVGACALADADLGARATTRRQFALLADHLAISGTMRLALLGPLKPPKVVMFCGHMITQSEQAAEERLAESVRAAFEEEEVGIGYGALASGSDIIMAEELLRRGGELNVVLPFDKDAFLQQSVDPAGDGWRGRFERCIEQARRATMVTDMPFMDDATQFAYGSLVCMGMARLRAQHLGAEVLQMAVWDGMTAHADPAGTAVDVANWRRTGGRARIISPTWYRGTTNRTSRSNTSSRIHAEELARETRALIFTDFRGFSKLGESVLPVFWNEVMWRMMEVLERHGEDVCYRNTWGDALYAVVQSAGAAADIALELQDSLVEVDYGAMGLKSEPHMRVGVHYGPVFRWRDNESGAVNYYGTQVSRAARIEPITPPGAVYVTEQFAAVLAMEAPEKFACRYVGQLPLAKAYGTARMYLLKRS